MLHDPYIPEVYSRITGYYRPVQNWNEGKLQEYKDRVTYDTGKSVLKKEPVSMRPVERVEAESQNESGEGLKKKPQLYLFTTLSLIHIYIRLK